MQYTKSFILPLFYVFITSFSFFASYTHLNILAQISSFILFFILPGYLFLKLFDFFDDLDFTQSWVYSFGLSLGIFMPIAIFGYLLRLNFNALFVIMHLIILLCIYFLFKKGKHFIIFKYVINKQTIFIILLYLLSFVISYFVFRIGGHQDSRPIFWDWIHHLGAIRIITERPFLSPYEWYFNTSNVEPSYGYNVLYVLIGFLAKYSKIDVIQSYLNLHSLLSFISIFVFYTFSYEVFRNRKIAVFSGYMFAIYQSMYWAFLPWRTILHSGGAFTPFILIPFSLIFFIKYVVNKDSKYYIPAILLGCSLVTYHIFSTFIYLFSIFSIMLSLILKNHTKFKPSYISNSLLVIFSLYFGFQTSIVLKIIETNHLSAKLIFLLLNLNSFIMISIVLLIFFKQNIKTIIINNIYSLKCFLKIIVPVLLFSLIFVYSRLIGQDLSNAKAISLHVKLILGNFYVVIPELNDTVIILTQFIVPFLLFRTSFASLFLFFSSFLPVFIMYNPIFCTFFGEITASTLVRRIFYDLSIFLILPYAIYIILTNFIRKSIFKLSAFSIVIIVFGLLPLFINTHRIVKDENNIPMINTEIKDVINFRKENGPLINQESIWKFMELNTTPGTTVLSDYYTSTLLPCFINNYVVSAYCIATSSSNLLIRREDTKIIFDNQTDLLDTLELLNYYNVSYILINSSYTLKEQRLKFDVNKEYFKLIYDDNQYILYSYNLLKGKNYIKSCIFNDKLKTRISFVSKGKTFIDNNNRFVIPAFITLRKDPLKAAPFCTISQNNGIEVTQSKWLAQPFIATKSNLASLEVFIGRGWELFNGNMIVELRNNRNSKPGNKILFKKEFQSPKMPSTYFLRMILNKSLILGNKYFVLIYSGSNSGDIGFFRSPDKPKSILNALSSNDSGNTWTETDISLSLILYNTEKYYNFGAIQLPLICSDKPIHSINSIDYDIESLSSYSIDTYYSLSKDNIHYTDWVLFKPNISKNNTEIFKYLKLTIYLKTNDTLSSPVINNISISF